MHIIGVLDAPSGPLSVVDVLSRPLTTPFALSADGVLLVALAAYLVGCRRIRGANPAPVASEASAAHRWPGWRALAFAGGVILLFVAVASGLARYQSRPSVLVIQHVLLMMAAPPLLVAGRPLCPWAAAWRAPRQLDPKGATSEAATQEPGSMVRVLRAVQGVISWPLYYGSMAVFFLTPVLADSVREPATLDAIECWFVAMGLLFFSGFTGRTRSGAPRSYGFRIAALLAGAPLETAVGMALVLWPRPVVAGTTLAATHSAGIVLWVASMCASGAVLGAVLVQWCLDDARRGAEIDLLLDAGVAMPFSSTYSGSDGAHSRP